MITSAAAVPTLSAAASPLVVTTKATITTDLRQALIALSIITTKALIALSIITTKALIALSIITTHNITKAQPAGTRAVADVGVAAAATAAVVVIGGQTVLTRRGLWI